jgi:ankyrin repeat protein
VDCRNGQGDTPLLRAIRHMQHDVILLLLDRGANVNTLDAQHPTPLHEASERGPLDVVQQLIDRGADINARNQHQGATPLHEASWSGKLAIIRLLIERGADVNSRDACAQRHYMKLPHWGISMLFNNSSTSVPI